jgi:hypothetical protein
VKSIFFGPILVLGLTAAYLAPLGAGLAICQNSSYRTWEIRGFNYLSSNT